MGQRANSMTFVLFFSQGLYIFIFFDLKRKIYYKVYEKIVGRPHPEMRKQKMRQLGHLRDHRPSTAAKTSVTASGGAGAVTSLIVRSKKSSKMASGKESARFQNAFHSKSPRIVEENETDDTLMLSMEEEDGEDRGRKAGRVGSTPPMHVSMPKREARG